MVRPRVLIIAEAANPELASVPLEGWSLSRALREVVDGHVVTQVRNSPAIDRFGWQQGNEYTAIDSEAVARPLYRLGEVLRRVTKLGWTATTAFAVAPYYYFEHIVWNQFADSIRKGDFNLVHRVTPLTPTAPSLLARRCRRAGVPFVWGPLNGGVPWPREFSGVQRQEGEWLSYVRGAHRLMPGYRSTRVHAAATITGSMSTWEQMVGYQDRCVYVPENGVDLARFPESRLDRDDGPLRVAFVGRLVPYKGADILVEAAAPLVRTGKVTLDIIGDGPQMSALKKQVATEEIAGGVRLEGWVEHTKLAQRLALSTVFAFPSIREFGGAVVLEAMALGLVPIVVDYAGPGEHVTNQTGFRVPLGPRRSIVERFRSVLAGLATARDDCRAIGVRARQRVVRWYTWQSKAQQILEVYRWVLGQRDKPDFGMPFPDITDGGLEQQATAPRFDS